MHKKILVVLAIIVLPLIFSSCGKEKVAKPNILLITIDTLRRDHLGVYGYPRETSPFIDKLAGEGMMFKHVVTPVPSTAPSHASILTSLHPLTHGVSGNASPLTEKAQTIAEVLQQNGYYTIGTVAAKFLSDQYKFSQGFDSFSDQWEEKPGTNTPFDRIASSVNESLIQQVNGYLANPQAKNKPFFIWVHYYDPHFPYRDYQAVTFKNPIKESENRHWKTMNLYDKEIRFTDDHIRDFYAFLKEKKLTRHLVTCITGDHGEEFGEHGTANGHADFYSEDTFVPLILHGYGIPEEKIIESYVSTMDIPVTLLGMANLGFEGLTEGLDLLKTDPESKAIKDRKMLIIGNGRYTRSLQVLGPPWSYILNFDYHYEYWYISQQDNLTLPVNTFETVNKKWLKTEKNTMVVPLPYVMKDGLNYLVFQANISKNKGFQVQVKMLPYAMSQKVKISPRAKTLTILYPTALQDRIVFLFEPRPGTVIDTDLMKYAFIAKEEFPSNVTSLEKIKNEVFETFPTLRKKKDKNEFFDLAADLPMMKDLIDAAPLKPKILEYLKMTYTAYKYYYQKGKKLLKGTMTKDKLTEEEKTMLKTLGYL